MDYKITITSKAGLIGYLEGNMRGIINMIELVPEKERTYSERRTLEYLKDALHQSEIVWEKVKTI